ncbi:MAG: phospholipase D-like domain-containing protein [Granulosicoccus sp.]
MLNETANIVDAGTVFSVAGVLHVLLVAIAGYHVLLNKQNEAAAFSWLGIIVLSPFFGVGLYWLFGINRIKRRARAEMPGSINTRSPRSTGVIPALNDVEPARWQGLMRLGTAIHHCDYLQNNRLRPLINGDETYPEMLKAIASSKNSVVLSSYIFEYDIIGRQFVDELIAANQRGVSVRVLIDGLGVGYGLSLVRSDRVLRQHGVKTARFLSAMSSMGTRFINLRNHRKILSVDGRIAYVGGMNIRDNNVLKQTTKECTLDVHFQVEGPIIDQINEAFAEDWLFAAKEALEMPRWQGVFAGSVTSRVLLDGPDTNFQKLQMTMVAAINAARSRVRIATPYFLPGLTIINALHLAVLRGVRIDILVPGKNNLAFVGWAMQANEGKLLAHGVHLHESPQPFDHSKLFTVDDEWSLIGSSNWDPRSLDLNFEINLECYSPSLNAEISRIFDVKCAAARHVTQARKHGLPARLRNNFFRLFSPYL